MNVAELLDRVDILIIPIALALLFGALWFVVFVLGRILRLFGLGRLAYRITNRKMIRFERRKRAAERYEDQREARYAAKVRAKSPPAARKVVRFAEDDDAGRGPVRPRLRSDGLAVLNLPGGKKRWWCHICYGTGQQGHHRLLAVDLAGVFQGWDIHKVSEHHRRAVRAVALVRRVVDGLR